MTNISTSYGNIIQLVAGGDMGKNSYKIPISHTCNMDVPININTNDDFKYHIPHEYDIINRFYIGFNNNYINIIDSVNLSQNGTYITNISGRFLYILNRLNGTYRKTSIRLPFPILVMPALNNSQLVIQIKFKPDVIDYNYNLPRLTKLKNMINTDIANVISKYIPRSDITLYKNISYTQNEERHKITMSGNYKCVNTYYEKCINVKTGETSIKINIINMNLFTTKLIFAFYKKNGDHTDILPILINGELKLNNMLHTVLTRQSSYEIDKLTFDNIVPPEEIYTITFDKDISKKDISKKDMLGKHSYLNTSRIDNIELSLNFKKQKFDMEIFIGSEGFDTCSTTGGYLNMRYTL
jgi:hypothetical protein